MASKTVDTPRSEPEKIDAWFASCAHPLKDVAQALRKVILSADPAVGEDIKWNHPSFFYTGPLAPFDPKEYKRYLIVFNLHSKDGCVMLVFWQGGRVADASGLLEGTYKDGRRLARFFSMVDVEKNRESLTAIIREQIRLIDS
jgi:hypothetical protein